MSSFLSIRSATLSWTLLAHLSLLLAAAEPRLARSDSTCSPASGEATLPSIVAGDGWTALNGVGHVLAAPARWSTEDWAVAGGIAGATAASFLVDTKAYDLMERNHSPFNDDATKIAVEYGSGAVAIGVPAALYLTGLFLKDQWLRETGLLAGTTMILASATTTLGKIAIGRARPYGGLGHSTFRPFDGREEFMSFPSGHTTAAFSLSAVLAARIKNPWASLGLYGVATGAAVSRMYTHDHWLSDVVFTAAYSSAIATSLVHWFEGREVQGEETGTFNVVPLPNGVRVVWRW